MKKVFSEYACPQCGWDDANFDGTFYKVVNGKQVFNLSDWDLKETGLPLPDNYYPKFGKRSVHRPGGFYGHQWEETYLCPKCNTVFTFFNSDI